MLWWSSSCVTETNRVWSNSPCDFNFCFVFLSHLIRGFTLGARDWLIFSTNHVNVRLYMALARASRDDTACSKLSALTICDRRENRTKVTICKGEIFLIFIKVHEQEGGRVTSSPLAVSFLCVSASPRAQPSTASSCKTTTHLFSAEPPRKIGRIFEHQAILAGLFWPLLDCLSEALWWYKFLLPRLRRTERFPDGGRRQWYSVNSEVGHKGNSEHFLEKTSAVLAFRGTYRE